MSNKLILVLLAALAGFIAALIPTWRRRTRFAVIAVVLVLTTALIVADYWISARKPSPVLAEVRPFENTPPIFEMRPYGDPYFDEVGWSVVLKVLNNSDSGIIVQDLNATFEGREKSDGYAKSKPRPLVDLGPTVDSFADPGRAQRVQYPFLLKAKSESYLQVHFTFQLLDASREPLRFDFLDAGYAMLPEIMAHLSVRIVLHDAKPVNVDTREYYPHFVGRRLIVGPDLVSEVWETSLGNVESHVAKLDHFGIYWKSRVNIRQQSGRVRVREWFNELPWYEARFNLEQDGSLTFSLPKTAPFVTVSQYTDDDTLELYTVGVDEQKPSSEGLSAQIRSGRRALRIDTFKSGQGRVEPEGPTAWEVTSGEGDKTSVIRLSKAKLSPDHSHMIFYFDGKKLLIWPFKIHYIPELLARSAD